MTDTTDNLLTNELLRTVGASIDAAAVKFVDESEGRLGMSDMPPELLAKAAIEALVLQAQAWKCWADAGAGYRAAFVGLLVEMLVAVGQKGRETKLSPRALEILKDAASSGSDWLLFAEDILPAADLIKRGLLIAYDEENSDAIRLRITDAGRKALEDLGS